MGLETAAFVIAGISRIGQASAQSSAAEAKLNALDLQAKQQQVVYQQKTLSNYDIVQHTLDAQDAQMTTRGTAFSSASFNAIQRDTLNIGAKSQKNLDVEDKLSQANIDIEKENVKRSLHAQIFGDIGDLASTGLNFARLMPKTES